MKNFKTNTKDANKLLQTIKSEFILKDDRLKSDGLWFELIEWDGIDKHHIKFHTECTDCHNSFLETKRDTSASRLTMGCIRLNVYGTYTIQMSKQVTNDDLNMKSIEI